MFRKAAWPREMRYDDRFLGGHRGHHVDDEVDTSVIMLYICLIWIYLCKKVSVCEDILGI